MGEHLELLDPFACAVWEHHDRLDTLVDESSCQEMIASFRRDGQKIPVLARPNKRADAGITHELIYGARRMFVARHLNLKLLARVRPLSDREAFVEMDVENRLRRELSPYERGMSYKMWLRRGCFNTQEELADALGLSTSRVSRLLKFAELPSALVTAFSDVRQIRESWAVALADYCQQPEIKTAMLSVSRSLARARPAGLRDVEVFRLLIDCRDGRRRRNMRARDGIVRSPEGAALFRVSVRYNDVHIIIPRDIAPSVVLQRATDALAAVFVREGGGVNAGRRESAAERLS